MISPSSISPVTKRANERGQISIFFASSVIVLISIIAFVINIGLFVKAKINLQNATDAGAYAGAAVQARMLNRIGYMNWEMRNNYKEWMFKYYVLGNLNIEDVAKLSTGGNIADPYVDYRMQGDPNLQDGTGEDIYNFPSVCLHYAGVPTNVCRRYAIPGIPRFEPTNLVGIDETTSSFIDAIVKEKSSDCSKRTQLNFNVANLWAYNLLSQTANNAFLDAPQVAIDRQGAWPRAVELAIRTRALEYAMNRPPTSLCANPSDGSPGCQSVITVQGKTHYGNERPLKAFWSAYRNLTNEGRDDNDDGQNEEEMKSSFTLTEIPPTSVNFPEINSLSTLLMGPKKSQPKYYLDLRLQLVNIVTFFTGLIARDDTLNASGQVVKAEGACDVSKIALPVPGYPLGFFKNPDVLTYYAVKGEAKFMGLFNPFGQTVKLTAWAAAKPMGGRIGPALFANTATTVRTRATANNRRSSAYISGLNLEDVQRKGTNLTVPIGTYAPGMPIPIDMDANDVSKRFWIKEQTDEVGGYVSGPSIVFGVPNLVYDFVNNNTDPNSNEGYLTAEQTNIIVPRRKAASIDQQFASGLYRTGQFERFHKNLVGTDTPDQIKQSIYNVRAPTAYEAANYTIPIPYAQALGQEIDGGFVDSFGFATGVPDTEFGVVRTKIYAPLFSANNEDALFSNGQEVVSEIEEFIRVQEEAMTKYRTSMNMVARSIFNDDPVKYRDAARRISDFDFTQDPAGPNSKPACRSIAGTFLYFYFKDQLAQGSDPSGEPCPDALIDGIREYFTGNTNDPLSFDPLSFTIEYSYKDNHPRPDITKWEGLLTGYMPGPRKGATFNGSFATPYSSEPETMRRSGYSAKFVTFKSLTNSGHYNSPVTNAAVYAEKDFQPVDDIKQTAFRNALDANSFPPTVNH